MSVQNSNPAYGPYTPIREVDGLFFVSGQVGVSPSDEVVPEGVSGQTTQALDNLAAVLAGAGLNLDNVVKTTVFLTDMADFAAMNDTYQDRFSALRPARSCIGVAQLPSIGNGAALVVEIEAIAARRPTNA